MRKSIISIILAIGLSINTYNTSVQAVTNVSNISDLKANTKEKIMENFNENKGKTKYKKDEILVKIKDNNSIELAKIIKEKYSLKVKKNLGHGFGLLTFDSSKYLIDEVLESLNKDYNIEYAEPNYSSKMQGSPTNEPDYDKLWGLKNLTNPGIDINIESGWTLLKKKSPIIVGVIDTGIDYNHKDLNNNLWVNQGEIPNNGKDDDNNGYIDDYMGWNFINGNNDPYDDNNHGTHISGIVAALDNDEGIVGVSPDAKIMPLKVADNQGTLYISDVIAAINYGLNKGVKIFNCSFSGKEFSQVEFDTIKNANALFICAAGNESLNNDSIPNFPANYDTPNIISVAAINKKGSLSYFSNYGTNLVDIAGPGEAILSTIPNGKYAYYDGTSMAAPYVTGVAALVFGENPSLDPLQVKNYILNNSRILTQLTGKISNEAIVDAGSTINALSGYNIINVSKVMLEKLEVDLNVGKALKLVATVIPAEATNKNVKWNSNNEAVVQVDDNGVLTALSPGKAEITVTTLDGGYTEVCLVNVTGLKIEQNGWVKNGDNWYYYKADKPQVGWQFIEGRWYHFNTDGARNSGWLKINGYQYYLEQDGKMVTGWKLIDGRWYFLADGGPMLIGWQHINGYRYYLDNDGKMATGWKLVEGKWYFLADGGPMLTGWQHINGYRYYLDSDGKMATGWKLVEGKWYFLADGGPMLIGWQHINGYRYYLGNDGKMATGWEFIQGNWYLLADGGPMLTGWQHINVYWYYLNENGTMVKGWLNYNGAWYYLYEGGNMAVNVYIGSYKIGPSGAWIK